MTNPAVIRATSFPAGESSLVYSSVESLWFCVVRDSFGTLRVLSSVDKNSWAVVLTVNTSNLSASGENAQLLVRSNGDILLFHTRVVRSTGGGGETLNAHQLVCQRKPYTTSTWDAAAISADLSSPGIDIHGPNTLGVVETTTSSTVFKLCYAQVELQSNGTFKFKIRTATYTIGTGWALDAFTVDQTVASGTKVLYQIFRKISDTFEAYGLIIISDVSSGKIQTTGIGYKNSGGFSFTAATSFLSDYVDQKFYPNTLAEEVRGCSHPTELGFAVVYSSINPNGSAHRLVQAKILFQTGATLLFAGSSTPQLVYQTYVGSRVEAIGIGENLAGNFEAIFRLYEEGISDEYVSQWVLGRVQKAFAASSWGTADAIAYVPTLDSEFVGYSRAVSSGTRPAGLEVLLGITSPLTGYEYEVAACYILSLPNSFVYNPEVYGHILLPGGRDGSMPSPPTSPPPVAQTGFFFPHTCPIEATYREVLRVEGFGLGSHLWIGGVDDLNEGAEESDEATSYIRCTVAGAQLEFFLQPPAMSPLGLSQALNLVIRRQNATQAGVGIGVYYKMRGAFYYELASNGSFNVSNAWELKYLVTNLPSSFEIAEIKVVLQVWQLLGVSPEIQISKMALAYCGEIGEVTFSPPTPETGFTQIIRSPPGVSLGNLVYDPNFGESGVPSSPPGPPTSEEPSIEDGDEILRPNRDISVRLFQNRPAFMRLNEPVDSNHDDPIFAPLLQPEYDAASGEYLLDHKPSLEIGFTQPVARRAWEHIQVRVKASRSLPPIQVVKKPPNYQASIEATEGAPDPVTVKPIETKTLGDWQRFPLEWSLEDSVDLPDGCHISIFSRAGYFDPAELRFGKVPGWISGVRRITARIRARVRTVGLEPLRREITGFTAEAVQVSSRRFIEDLEVPEFQLYWNPLTCEQLPQAWFVAHNIVKGAAYIRSEKDLNMNFYLRASEESGISVRVSVNQVQYSGGLSLTLQAGVSQVIYYEVVTNSATLLGAHQVAILFEAAGPTHVGPPLQITGPPSTPFSLQVADVDFVGVGKADSLRIGLTPRGNAELGRLSRKTTSTLEGDWVVYEASWTGLWKTEVLRDLILEVQAELLYSGGTPTFCDIDSLELVATYFDPQIDGNPRDKKLSGIISLVPTGDKLNLKWSPRPAWPLLLESSKKARVNAVSTVLGDANKLSLEMGFLTDPPEVQTGYTRVIKEIFIEFQAQTEGIDSTTAVLEVDHRFGGPRITELIGEENKSFRLHWEISEGVTISDLQRLFVSLRSQRVRVGSRKPKLFLRELVVDALYVDVESGGSTPVSGGAASLPKISSDSELELFSVGSLNRIGLSPEKEVTEFQIRNWDSSSAATVTFTITGDCDCIVQGGLSQTISANGTLRVKLYGHVGSVEDPYPDLAVEGIVQVSLDQSGLVTKRIFKWFYTGQ